MDNLNPGNESSEANQEVDLLEGVTFDGEEMSGKEESSDDQDLENKGKGNDEEVVVVVAPKDRKPEDEKKKDEPKFINQEKVNKVINEKHRKMREAEERVQALEEKSLKLEQQLAAFTAQKRPAIPDTPDPLDPNIVALTVTRDKAIADAAAFDVKANQTVEERRQQQQRQQEQAAQEVNTQVQQFGKRAADLGYTPEKLAESERLVVSHLGSNNPLNRWILGQEDGPLLVDFLSQNLHFTEQLSKVSPTDAAIKIRSFMPGVQQQPAPGQTEQERLLNNPAPAKRQNSNSRNSVKTTDPYLQGVKFS